MTDSSSIMTNIVGDYVKSEFLIAAFYFYVFFHLNKEITLLCEVLRVSFRDREGPLLLKQALCGSAQQKWQCRHIEVDHRISVVLTLLLKLLSVPGVEPEPFEIGDHIVEASGKMCLLDNSFHSCMLGMSYWDGVDIGRKSKLGKQTTSFSHRLSSYSSQHKHWPIYCTLLTTWKK